MSPFRKGTLRESKRIDQRSSAGVADNVLKISFCSYNDSEQTALVDTKSAADISALQQFYDTRKAE